MHFYYLDESGCTGADINNREQRIFVLGGISVRDEGWNETQKDFTTILSDYFDGNIPDGFEIHTEQLLARSENGQIPERQKKFAKDILDMLNTRKHDVHFFAVHKQELNNAMPPENLDYGGYDLKIPYLVAYDYLLTQVNQFITSRLGRTARGMFIIDNKEQFNSAVQVITKFRRFKGIPQHRIKRIVEFSYPVDSKKNAMVQLSDLVVFCVRRFLEIESGYRDNYPQEVKQFFAECYQIIDSRNKIKTLIDREGRGMDALNDYLKAVQAKPSSRWKQRYNL